MLPVFSQMPLNHPLRSETDQNVTNAFGIGEPNLPGIDKSYLVIPRVSNAYLSWEILQTRKHRVFLVDDRGYMCPEPKIKGIPQHRAGDAGIKDIIADQILRAILDNMSVRIFE
jgi:hypothetical protein